MNLQAVASRVEKGEVVTFKTKGNSMAPRIKGGEHVTVYPIEAVHGCGMGDVVLAKIRGRWYLHLVTAVDSDKVQISNNKGHVNGWTHVSKVVGVADR